MIFFVFPNVALSLTTKILILLSTILSAEIKNTNSYSQSRDGKQLFDIFAWKFPLTVKGMVSLVISAADPTCIQGAKWCIRLSLISSAQDRGAKVQHIHVHQVWNLPIYTNQSLAYCTHMHIHRENTLCEIVTDSHRTSCQWQQAFSVRWTWLFSRYLRGDLWLFKGSRILVSCSFQRAVQKTGSFGSFLYSLRFKKPAWQQLIFSWT